MAQLPPFPSSTPAVSSGGAGASASVDVCIHGAGPVGASLALALAHQGLRTALVAPHGRFDPRDDDLRAYALNGAAVALLERLRVWSALPADARAAVQDMRVSGDAGGRIDFSAWQQGVSELAWIVDAAALERCLGEALRYAPGVQLVAAPVAAPLQALCEGRDSATRAAVGARFERHPYGHSAVAARLELDQPHHQTAWQWFRSPDILALLPFDRPTPGRSFGLVWSMPQAEAERWVAADVADFEQALNDAVVTAAARGDGAVPGRLRLASARAAWPLVHGHAHPWTGPGWALLGDAAHAMHPLAGQGLNTGFADVVCLARVLGEARAAQPWRSLGDERLLRRYARERAVPAAAMSGLVDGLWHLFAAAPAPLQELRNRGMTLVNQLSPVKRLLAGRALDLS